MQPSTHQQGAAMNLKLCKDCRFYKGSEGPDESLDICTNDLASHGGVRKVKQYSCYSMRAGVCGKEAGLFSAKTAEQGR
jgi:hypothetical protein